MAAERGSALVVVMVLMSGLGALALCRRGRGR